MRPHVRLRCQFHHLLPAFTALEHDSRIAERRDSVVTAGDKVWIHGVCTDSGTSSDLRAAPPRLFQKHGATLVGQASVQSVWSNYYRKPLENADAVAVDAGSITS